MRIDIVVDSSPATWGPTCTAELAARAAETLAAWIGEVLQVTYPRAEVNTGAHDYTQGETTKLVTVTRCTLEEWNVVHDLAEHVAATRWTDALASALPTRRGKPRSGQRPARVSTTVPPDVDLWLREQEGGIGAAITRLVRAAMGEGE